MQIECVFRTRQPVSVPLNYNYQVQSAIYAKLREVNVSDFLHDGGFGEGRVYRAFVFGKLSGRHSMTDRQMLFTDEMALEIRSPLFELTDALQRSFELRPEIKLFDSELELGRMNISNRHIAAQRAVFFTDSPVVVHETAEGGKTVYYSPDGEEFFKRLEDNFRNKYRAVTGAPAGKIKISPSGAYKKLSQAIKVCGLPAIWGGF